MMNGLKKGKLVSDKQPPAGFINRWSARKQQLAREKTQEASRSVAEAPENIQPLHESIENPDVPFDIAPAKLEGEPPVMAQAAEARTSSAPAGLDAVQSETLPTLTDADMPPIESLSSDSDISGFFSEGVSAALKKAALRHVFLQPKYNVRDGLNDYDGDYTVFEPLGDTITSDMKWHTARKERERLEAQAREQAMLDEHSTPSESDESPVDEQGAKDDEPDDLHAEDQNQEQDQHQSHDEQHDEGESYENAQTQTQPKPSLAQADESSDEEDTSDKVGNKQEKDIV